MLHTFTYDADGGFPFPGPTTDAKGNVYGVTSFSGSTDGVCCGTVYELSPQKGGRKYRIIYTFQGGSYGEAPYGGLTLDAAGNLYGTTTQGGRDIGTGLVYELSPTKDGKWKKADLHKFVKPYAPTYDGALPSSYLVFDKIGNLYGTTQLGGGHNYNDCGETTWGCGTVFELSPEGDGKWKETQLHRFPDGNADGLMPYGGLTFDPSGNLWGTTQTDTLTGLGTVFELTRDTKGKWKESALFNFTGNSTGYQTQAGLVADAAGNVYGTTFFGGNGGGTVFEITPQSGGGLLETLIHQFASCNQTSCPDGLNPFGGLAIDANGNLYGTTTQGGGAGSFCSGGQLDVGCGTVFELVPAGNGQWNYSILYASPGSTAGAYLTDDRLSIATNGDIFGTTFAGGDVGESSKCPEEVPGEAGCGVVFELTPQKRLDRHH
ncbi:MAG TPA: choice-of-anchor tandem repeat GloVer-containing protein [Rhizomicrobium sp.]